jgi:hypothetical protein
MNIPSYDPTTHYNNQESSSDYHLSPDDHDYMSKYIDIWLKLTYEDQT